MGVRAITAACEHRLERLARERLKAWAMGDREHHRALNRTVQHLALVNSHEERGTLTATRANRLRVLWLAGRLVDYSLDGSAVPEWIKEQRRQAVAGGHWRRMMRVQQARTPRLASRRALPEDRRPEQRPRERRPQSRRVARTTGNGGDPDPPPEPSLATERRGLLVAAARIA
jgi:hypothetical protein